MIKKEREEGRFYRKNVKREEGLAMNAVFLTLNHHETI